MKHQVINRLSAFALAAMVVFAGLSIRDQISASAESDGEIMERVLELYKEGDYTGAAELANLTQREADEDCVKNMPKKMKKAYLKQVKKSVKKNKKQQYVWDYFLTDIDNDWKSELLIEIGSAEYDVHLDVYSCPSKKAKKVGTVPCSHSEFFAYPNHNGLIMMPTHMGEEGLILVTLDGSTDTSDYGWHSPGMEESEEPFVSMAMGWRLKYHVQYSSDYSKRWLDYSDLK